MDQQPTRSSRLSRLCARLLLTAVLALAGAGARGAAVKLSATDAAGKWGPELQTLAEHARQRAEDRLGLKLNAPVEVLSLPDEFEFERYLGGSMENIVAVARPERNQIVINRRALYGQDRARREQTLVHEMTHLLLGRSLKKRLPAWLDEGLAMLTAEEHDFDSNWRVLVAGTFDTLIPIERLKEQVASGEGSQEQAYAQSLSLTRFYIRLQFPDQKGNDPAPLVKALADPARGEGRIRQLWDPQFTASLENQWRHSWQIVWAMLIFLSGSSFLWMMITLLFLAAWWRRRRLMRAMRERFGEEPEDGDPGHAWETDFEAEESWAEDESEETRP